MDRVKYLFLTLFVSWFIFGCASSQPDTYMGTSAPIFILNQPDSKSVFIDFKDYDKSQTSQTIAKILQENGYNIVLHEDMASIIVKGGINYIKRDKNEKTHGYMGVGFGFGSHGRRSRDFEFGLSHTFFGDDVSDGGYDGQASLFLRIKHDKKIENHSTNLNFQTEKNVHSYAYAKKLFSEKIAQKIVEFLSFK